MIPQTDQTGAQEPVCPPAHSIWPLATKRSETYIPPEPSQPTHALTLSLERLESVAPTATAEKERREIQNLAIQVLCDYDPGYTPAEIVRRWAHRQLVRAGQYRPPFDLLPIATGMGATVERLSLESNGRVLINGDRAIILLNASAHPEQQRCTLAHELTHIFFRRVAEHVLADRPDSLREVNEWGNSERQEWLCDLGAAELLAPEPFFRSAWKKTRARGMVLGERLAEQFQCSLTFALRRLVALGYRSIVTEWSLRDRAGSTIKLRTERSCSSLRRKIYIPVHKPANHGPIVDALDTSEALRTRMVVEVRGLPWGAYTVEAKRVAEGRVISTIDLESFELVKPAHSYLVLNLL